MRRVLRRKGAGRGGSGSVPTPAFTLIEVLVATFIFALVLASLFGTWKVIARSTESALQITAEAQRTRLALQMIDSSLSSAQMFQANAPKYAFLADTSGTFGALSFVANLGETFPGSGYFGGQQLRRLTLTVESAPEGGNDLILRQQPLLAPPDLEGDSHPLTLARDVTAFQLEFWDPRGNEFVPEWLTTNQLPRAVRVTMGFGTMANHSKRPAQLITRSIRLPDNAVPGDLQGTAGPPQRN